jgi:hypothetical protein
MKFSELFRTKRPQVGWQGPSSEPNPILIGAIVALVMAGAYMALILFGSKG